MSQPPTPLPATPRWTPERLMLGSAAGVGFLLLAMSFRWATLPAVPYVGVEFQLLAALPLALWVARALAYPGEAAWSPRSWLLMLALAGGLRLILLDLPPTQSDDLYRYVWEGRIAWHGINPFALAPDSPELIPLRDDLWYSINHPHLPAIYPPLAQWVMMLAAGAAMLAGSPVLWMKLVFVACDLLTLVLLRGWLRERGRSDAWLALWAFHPLVIAEFSGNGHLDSLMTAALTGSLWMADRHRRLGTARTASLGLAGVTAAGLAKLIPFALVPYWWHALRGRRRAWLLAVPVVAAFAYLPYASAGIDGLLHSIRAYGMHWSGNGPAFELLVRLCDGDGFLARRVLWAGLALWAAGWWVAGAAPARAALPVLGAYLVLSPVVHPWYLTLVLPLVAATARNPWPWLWLTATVPLVYLQEHPGGAAWTVWAVWTPFWLAWAGGAAAPLISRAMRRQS